jgi:predicted homoserine dehydrogenase-like protein
MGEMAERMRLGIVGAGAATQVGHLPALKRVKEIQVVGICDNDLSKARALADRFGIPDAYSDIEELVEFEQLDALLVCTPSHLHESHVLAGLSAKLHIFVERPLGLTVAGAQKLTKAAQRNDRLIMVIVPTSSRSGPACRTANWATSSRSAPGGSSRGRAGPRWAGARSASSPAVGRCSTLASACSIFRSG